MHSVKEIAGRPTLVVDDDESEAEYIAELLTKSLGVRCETESDPSVALSIVGKRPYDLVISDLVMPKRDGLALLAEIKSIAPKCEVIISTAFPEMTSAIAAMKLGAVDYLPKSGLRDGWEDRIIEATSWALRVRPSNRAPGYHRENLIHFMYEQTCVRHSRSEPSAAGGALLAGLALEYLSKLLIESCPGLDVTIHRRRGKNEENDLICLNQVDKKVWARHGSIVLVECKDRRDWKPSEAERGRLEQKVQNRRGQASIGIYISTSGFAKGFLEPTTQLQIGNVSPIIIPIDKDDLTNWVHAEHRLEWLTERLISSSI